MKADALEKSLKQLNAGQSPEQVLNQLAHTLTNKVLHAPTARMKEAAELGHSHVIDSARTLLDLPPPK